MKKMDTLKYLVENFVRVIRHEQILHQELTEVQRRDHVIQRNEYLNECVKVLMEELNIYEVKPVRFMKLNVKNEIREIYSLINKLQAAEEEKKNAAGI